MSASDFQGLAVVTFEARRSAEMASLIERHGGAPVQAPALREVRTPLAAQGVTDATSPDAASPDAAPREAAAPAPAAPSSTVAFARDLAAGALDLVVLLTGVGTRALVEEVSPTLPREAFVEALSRTRVVARGPKPAAVLRELGVPSFVSVPSPNTYRELLATLDATFGEGWLAGKRVAVQEYGAPAGEVHAGLAARGAEVVSVQVYTWALPEDTSKLRRALHMLARREARVAMFTTRAQVEHALLVAAEEGIEADVRAALAEGVVASIGPVCSEALRAEGLAPDIEPEHPKMGHLVKEAAARSVALLAAKRAQ